MRGPRPLVDHRCLGGCGLRRTLLGLVPVCRPSPLRSRPCVYERISRVGPAQRVSPSLPSRKGGGEG